MFCSLINIHLLSLLDGSPHEVPLQKVLSLGLGRYSSNVMTSQRIGSSTIALVVEFFSHAVKKRHKELIVWDWRTGEKVREFFFAGGVVLAKPPPRFSGARTTTQVLVKRSWGSLLLNLSVEPGYSPCPIFQGQSCLSSIRCCQSTTREAGKSCSSPTSRPQRHLFYSYPAREFAGRIL